MDQLLLATRGEVKLNCWGACNGQDHDRTQVTNTTQLLKKCGIIWMCLTHQLALRLAKSICVVTIQKISHPTDLRAWKSLSGPSSEQSSLWRRNYGFSLPGNLSEDLWQSNQIHPLFFCIFDHMNDMVILFKWMVFDRKISCCDLKERSVKNTSYWSRTTSWKFKQCL
jgi:hypothetical protein